MDSNNIQMWIVVGLLWFVGLAAWVMTYILVPIKSKKTNTNISGIPGVAFILFLIAGLLSPYKLLALICLVDFSVLWLIFEIISALISGDLKYDWGKIFVHTMWSMGYPEWDDSVIAKFNEYYKECISNKEYKRIVKRHRYDFEKFCRIVAGLRICRDKGCPQGDAYNLEKIWGVSEWGYNILKETLPEDVRDLVG